MLLPPPPIPSPSVSGRVRDKGARGGVRPSLPSPPPPNPHTPHPHTPHTPQTANKGRLGGDLEGEANGGNGQAIDLKTTLSKPFIERIRATQRLAAGESRAGANATMTAVGVGAAAPSSLVERADSPAPLLLMGRESSIDSTVPLVRGSGSALGLGGMGEAGALGLGMEMEEER